jgi:UDPglucose--hexose-1-phosphate uridylyltransferase
MAKAPVETTFTVRGFDGVKAGIVKWPMSVIRLKAEQPEPLIELGDYILSGWREYTDETAFVYGFSASDGTLLTAEEVQKSSAEEKKAYQPHNTITPIARKAGGVYELDLVLRNNVTTKEHPFGVYHPHAELHHIKKENIGLIEVMGLAVLPSRLKEEMEVLKSYILTGTDLASDEMTAKHKAWVENFLPKYPELSNETIDGIIEKEIGLVFSTVLEHAGVYKRTEEGKDAFLRFIKHLNQEV